MKYFKYGNSGGIDKVIERELNSNSGYYNSLLLLLDSCMDYGNFLKIVHHAYDKRLSKEVYMIIGDHSGLSEQFVSYFIEEK